MKRNHFLLYSSFSLSPFKLWLCALLQEVVPRQSALPPDLHNVVCAYVISKAEGPEVDLSRSINELRLLYTDRVPEGPTRQEGLKLLSQIIHRAQENHRVHESLRQLRERIITAQIVRVDGEEGMVETQMMGSRLETFVRQCIIANGQMMLEQQIQLNEAMDHFLRGEPYQWMHSRGLLENQLEEELSFERHLNQPPSARKAALFEQTGLDKKEYFESEFSAFQKRFKTTKFHQLNLALAKADVSVMDDTPAVFKVHQFNDYNLRLLDRQEQIAKGLGAVAVNRIHRSSLTMAAVQFKLGNYEAALASVEECIKIAQSKNDAESVLDCTVWLYQISGALGGEENYQQQQVLLEHLILQSNKQKKLYALITSLLNLAQFPSSKNLNLAVTIPHKLKKFLKEYEVQSSGGRPLWSSLLMVAQRKLIQMAEKGAQAKTADELKTQFQLMKAKIWGDLGGSFLSGAAICNCLRIFGTKVLQKQQVINSILAHFLTMIQQGTIGSRSTEIESQPSHLEKACTLIDNAQFLMSFDHGRLVPGQAFINPFEVELHLPFLLAFHQQAVSTHDFSQAALLEQVLSDYVAMFDHRPQYTAVMQLAQLRRLVADRRDLMQAFTLAEEIVEFCSENHYDDMKLEAKALIIEIYLLADRPVHALSLARQLKEEVSLTHSKTYFHLLASLLEIESALRVEGMLLDAMGWLNDLEAGMKESQSMILRQKYLTLRSRGLLKLCHLVRTSANVELAEVEKASGIEAEPSLEAMRISCFIEGCQNEVEATLKKLIAVSLHLQDLPQLKESLLLLGLLTAKNLQQLKQSENVEDAEILEEVKAKQNLICKLQAQVVGAIKRREVAFFKKVHCSCINYDLDALRRRWKESVQALRLELSGNVQKIM